MAWNRKKRLRLVCESDAEGQVAEAFSDIKYFLGFPFVGTYFQALAAVPGFLPLYWRSMQPMIRSEEFVTHAERLRAEAYTTLHNYFQIPDLAGFTREQQFTTGAQQELGEVIDFFQYRDPMLLLMCALQGLAFDGTGQALRPLTPLANDARPQTSFSPTIVPEENAPPRVHNVLDDVRRTLDLPSMLSDYLALARWPDFLDRFWADLKPVVSSPLYGEYKRRLQDAAMAHAAQLPLPAQLTLTALEEQKIAKEDLASVVHLNEAFLDVFASGTLNVSFAKIGLEGGNRPVTHRAA